MSLCPCKSNIPYSDCCGLYLEQGQLPATPEQLMRSRYTAYSLRNLDYIKRTMRGKALIGFNVHEVEQSTSRIDWVDLKILQSYLKTPELGFVEFDASYLEKNQLKHLQELSEFHKINHQWFYVDGVQQPAAALKNKQIITKNSPCPCGSGKKFKNCHEK